MIKCHFFHFRDIRQLLHILYLSAFLIIPALIDILNASKIHSGILQPGISAHNKKYGYGHHTHQNPQNIYQPVYPLT